MNIYPTGENLIAVFTAAEARELAALMRTTDLPTFRWPVGISLRAKLTRALKNAADPLLGLGLESCILRHLSTAPEGLGIYQLKAMLNTSPKDLESLADTLLRLCEEGVLQRIEGETEPIYLLGADVDPMAKRSGDVDPDEVESAREQKVKKQIVRLLTKLGAETSKTSIAKALNLDFATAQIALNALIAAGEVAGRQDGKFHYYRLPGVEVKEKTPKGKKDYVRTMENTTLEERDVYMPAQDILDCIKEKGGSCTAEDVQEYWGGGPEAYPGIYAKAFPLVKKYVATKVDGPTVRFSFKPGGEKAKVFQFREA